VANLFGKLCQISSKSAKFYRRFQKEFVNLSPSPDNMPRIFTSHQSWIVNCEQACKRPSQEFLWDWGRRLRVLQYQQQTSRQWSEQERRPRSLSAPDLHHVISKQVNLCSRSSPYSLNCHIGAMLVFCMLCRITQSSDSHRTESASVMDHEQTMGVNSSVLDQKQQNIFGHSRCSGA